MPVEEDLSVMLGKYIPLTSAPVKAVKETTETGGFSTFSLYDYDYSYKSGRMENKLRRDILFVKKVFLRVKNMFAGKKRR